MNHHRQLAVVIVIFTLIISLPCATWAQGGGACSTPNFSKTPSYPGGRSTPIVSATRDLNGDGKLDLIVINNTSPAAGSVAVLLGLGNGAFGTPTEYNAGVDPNDMTLGDFNGDGKVDVAVTSPVDNISEGEAGVFLGDGNGHLVLATYFSSRGIIPHSITSGDFNNDNILDLAISNLGNISLQTPVPPNISIMLGTGSGTFSSGAILPVEVNASELTVGDFNGDGKTDLAHTGPQKIVVRPGTGTGIFNASINSPITTTPVALAVYDFNNDGKPDMAATEADPRNKLVILIGAGTGGFNAPTYFDTGKDPGSIALGDFNGDGKLDIATPNISLNAVSIMPGTGPGSFGAYTQYIVGGKPADISAGDFNGDGKLDLVTPNRITQDVSVLIGDGGGNFDAPRLLAVGRDTDSLAMGDFNGDGKLDLAVPNIGFGTLFVDNFVAIMLGTGGGKFAPAVYYDVGTFAHYTVTADFNGDAKLDLAIAGAGTNIAIMLGTGTGAFAPPTLITGGMSPSQLVVGDYNGDSKPDLAALSFSSRYFSIMLGNGAGGFNAPTNYDVGLDPAALAAGDFNNDGKLDIAVANSGDGFFPGSKNVMVFAGTGTGAFNPPATISMGNLTPVDLITRDFNGDGKLDLAVSNIGANDVQSHIAILLGTGTGSFGAANNFYFGVQSGAGRVTASDLNGDGKLDLAVALNSGSDGAIVSRVAIMLGDGAGSFGTLNSFPVGPFARNLKAADLNGDNRNDLAVVGTDALGVTILLNKCAATRRAPFDFDGDGKTDVSVFRPANGYWYINNSSDNSFLAVQHGANGDRVVPGDYDGDGKADTAVFRPTNGTWYILNSSDNSFRSQQFGQSGDITAAGDYDGDGKTDIAVFRPSAGTFYLLYSSDNSFHYRQWGTSGDVAVMGDYDGDGKTDFAIFRPSTGAFYILRSSDGGVIGQQFGQNGDVPVAADFDADSKTDIAVYRPTTGGWYYLQSTDNSFRALGWGTSGDIAAAGDYDGDGKWDVAVFRPSTGTFYILQSTNNALRAAQFGTNGDVPVASP